MTGLAGLPPPPGSLRVEVVDVAPPHAPAGTRALSVVSRFHARRLALAGMVAGSAAGVVASAGLATLGLFGGALAEAWYFGRGTPPLLIFDDRVLTPERRYAPLDGITDVTLSMTHVWLHRGRGERWMVFTSARLRPRLWIARLLREVIALGHLPAALTLPPARLR